MIKKTNILILLIGFLLGLVATPTKAEDPPKPPQPEKLDGANRLGHNNEQQETLKLELYYQVEEELWQSFQNNSNSANLQIEGNQNNASINQSAVGNFGNAMIFGNHNSIKVEQHVGSSYTSVFVEGSNNTIKIIQ